ncbi:sugar phosphate isomerase/epimerase family protein [Flavobacterium silvaticum]|uniref:Sugar phosphate isomerase/epimerase n=1 Tax=Flavobacterium silvaticum TaxID=1852020 RepID=A0A972FLI5_9FLAO|nr:sugar phosphate isomerase/epimerase [Flavobacterium silvaticum]NMH27933.1 sugar phosphate isomerase/epimerase [Flavobacterium silvaticum]
MQRRSFLQTLALGAASMYVAPSFAFPGTTKKSLGMQLYTVRDAMSKNPAETLQKIAKLGFSEVELYGYEAGKLFGLSIPEFKKMLADAGLKAVSSHHMLGQQSQAKGTLLYGWEKAVEDMAALQVGFMACAWLDPLERNSEIYRKLPEILEKCGRISKPSGIQLAYHNHDFEFEKLGESTAYDHIIQNTSPEFVAMELDLYWISKAGLDPIAYFDSYPGRFQLWHVKDMAAGTQIFTEVGNGTIDFDRIFKARDRAGLKHWFIEQDESTCDVFESLTMSRDYVLGKNY